MPDLAKIFSKPLISAFSARDLASDLSLKARSCLDPSVEWRRRDAPTVSDLASRFLTEYLPGKKRPTRESTIESYETILRRHVIPAFGSKLVEQVTTGDVERLQAEMRHIPYQANRTLAVLLQAFDGPAQRQLLRLGRVGLSEGQIVANLPPHHHHPSGPAPAFEH